MKTVNWIFEGKKNMYNMSVEITKLSEDFLHILSVDGTQIATWTWGLIFPDVCLKARAEKEFIEKV
jgi:hypothetical protein